MSSAFPGRCRGRRSTNDKEYLYKKTNGIWKSLGPRSPETETIYNQFHAGRENSKERVARLAQRLDELAPVNRAMALGRVPLLTARIIRALDKLGLIGTAIDVVGTNALFVYERMAGVHITSGLLSTQDVDLLMDSRFSLRLITKDFSHKGLIGLLQKIDHSFVPLAKNGYRAANRDGFLVDLIKPVPKDVMSSKEKTRFSADADDLQAIEIEGLSWLVNSPKTQAVVIDRRGYPLSLFLSGSRGRSRCINCGCHGVPIAMRPSVYGTAASTDRCGAHPPSACRIFPLNPMTCRPCPLHCVSWHRSSCPSRQRLKSPASHQTGDRSGILAQTHQKFTRRLIKPCQIRGFACEIPIFPYGNAHLSVENHSE